MFETIKRESTWNKKRKKKKEKKEQKMESGVGHIQGEGEKINLKTDTKEKGPNM